MLVDRNCFEAQHETPNAWPRWKSLKLGSKKDSTEFYGNAPHAFCESIHRNSKYRSFGASVLKWPK